MGWTTITKPTQGLATLKSLIDAVIDCLTYLFNVIGGSGTDANSGVLNGSFENDVDADGTPDEWEAVLEHASGTHAIETTNVAHGAKAWKTTSNGNGGANLATKNYTICAGGRPFFLELFLYSSVAGVRNTVDVLWYDKAKSYISTSTPYDSVANPTAYSWTALICTPPATAMFFKIKLTGCKAGTAVAGTTYFDGVRKLDVVGQTTFFTIAEVTRSSATYATVATRRIWIPANAKTLVIMGQMKCLNPTGSTRYTINAGAVYSDEKTYTGGPYADVTHTIDVAALAGQMVSLSIQIKHNNAEATEYTKVEGDTGNAGVTYFL